MGTFTDNLLKLTEFPFSYSLIGLIVWIWSGGGGLLEDISLQRLGPFLIIMGFIATTLSIVDPSGYAQKAWLVGWLRAVFLRNIYRWFPWTMREEYTSSTILNMKIFGSTVREEIKVCTLLCLIPNFRDVFVSLGNKFIAGKEFRPKSVLEKPEDLLDPLTPTEDELDKPNQPLLLLEDRIQYLKTQTAGTTWLVREIDKITSLFYFIAVVSVFVYAILLYPHLLNNFLIPLRGGDQTADDSGMLTSSGTAATATTTTGTNPTTVSNSTGDGSLIINSIIIFSIIALGVVSLMIFFRLRALRSRALTTFKYLAVLDAIKIDNESFDRNLQEIKQSLTEGDWTLANYWTNRTLDEYENLIRKKWQEGEIRTPPDITEEIVEVPSEEKPDETKPKKG